MRSRTAGRAAPTAAGPRGRLVAGASSTVPHRGREEGRVRLRGLAALRTLRMPVSALAYRAGPARSSSQHSSCAAGDTRLSAHDSRTRTLQEATLASARAICGPEREDQESPAWAKEVAVDGGFAGSLIAVQRPVARAAAPLPTGALPPRTCTVPAAIVPFVPKSLASSARTFAERSLQERGARQALGGGQPANAGMISRP